MQEDTFVKEKEHKRNEREKWRIVKTKFPMLLLQ